MDSLLEKLLTSGSPLLVLTVICWLFLKHLAAEASNNRAYLADQASINREFHAKLQAENSADRAETREALKLNAAATNDNTKALASFSTAMAGSGRKEHG